MLDKATKKVEFSLGQSKKSTLIFKFRYFLLFTEISYLIQNWHLVLYLELEFTFIIKLFNLV